MLDLSIGALADMSHHAGVKNDMSISDYPVGTKFIPVRKWAKENDVPERTAYRWAHAGKLESLVLGPKAFVIVERPEAAMA